MIALLRLFPNVIFLMIALSFLSFASKSLADLNLLDAIALGVSFGLSLLLLQTIAGLAFAALAFAAAGAFLLAPLALGLKSLFRDACNARAKPSQRQIIERLYPAPTQRRFRMDGTILP